MKLGIPDDREPDYTQYFIHAPVSELTNAQPVPAQLTVPAGLTTDLTIRIDFAGMVSQPSLAKFLPHLLMNSCHDARSPSRQEPL